jgi:hypothetical protein
MPTDDTARSMSPAAVETRRRLIERVRADWIDGPAAPLAAAVGPWEYEDVSLVLGTSEGFDGSLESALREHGTKMRLGRERADPARFYDLVGGRVLLVGNAGCGKSVFLWRLARSLLDRCADDPSRPVPFVIELRRWTADTGSLREFVIAELEASAGVEEPEAADQLDSGELVLLLDGLDELAWPELVACATRVFEHVRDRPEQRVLLTCRAEAFESLLRYDRSTGAVGRQLTEPTSGGVRLAMLRTPTAAGARRRLAAGGPRFASVRAVVDEIPKLAEVLADPGTWVSACNVLSGLTVDETRALVGRAGRTATADLLRQRHLANELERSSDLQARHAQYVASRMRDLGLTVVGLHTLGHRWFNSHVLSVRTHIVAGVIAGIAFGIIGSPLGLLFVSSVSTPRDVVVPIVGAGACLGALAGLAVWSHLQLAPYCMLAGWSPSTLWPTGRTVVLAWVLWPGVGAVAGGVVEVLTGRIGWRDGAVAGIAYALYTTSTTVADAVANGFVVGHAVEPRAGRPAQPLVQASRASAVVIAGTLLGLAPLALAASVAFIVLGRDDAVLLAVVLCLAAGLVGGVGGAERIGFGAVWSALATNFVLRRRGLAPAGFRRLLESMTRAGLMYPVGGVWRFTHRGLQHWLAAEWERLPEDGLPRRRRAGTPRGVDVALLASPTDDAAVRTLRRAMEREGWSVGRHDAEAATAVVVWSETSADDSILADSAKGYLDQGTLLQLLVQPPGHETGQPGAVEAPDPFRYYEAIEVESSSVDDSDDAADHLADGLLSGRGILPAVSAMGHLDRPRDHWNARLTLYKTLYRRRRLPVALREYSGRDGRLLRCRAEEWPDPDSIELETARGNIWSVRDVETGTAYDCRVIDADEVTMRLPASHWFWTVRRG